MAVPVGMYIVSIYLLYMLMMRTVGAFHVLVIAATIGVLAVAVWLAAAGVSMANCLLVVTLAPVVAVLLHEWVGHRHTEQALAKSLRTGPLPR